MRKKIPKILLVIFLLLGFALRAQETISQNFLFLLDQGRDMMAVKNIVYGHHLTLIGPYTSLQGVFQGPLWYYLLAIPTIIGNGDPYAAIVLMLTLSIGILIIVYLWMKKLFGKKAALFTLFLFAVSPEAVAAATFSWNPHPMWLLITLYIFFFYKLITKNHRYHLMVWPLISIMFHFETALAVFILTASLIYLLIFNRALIKQKYSIYGALIAGIFFLPQVLFDLRHNFLMSKSILNLFTGSDRGLFVSGESKNYLSMIYNHTSLFYYNFETSFMRDGYLKNLPKLAFIFMIGMVAFGRRFKILTEKENMFIFTLSKLVVIVIILSLLYPFPIRYWFLTGFQSFYILIFGLLLSRAWGNQVGKIAIILFFIVSLYYTTIKLYSLYILPPDFGGVAKIKGKKQAIDAIYAGAKGKQFNLLVFTPPVNTDAYDYLIWWYGKIKYNYLPKQEKRGVFYLLIEPDYSKPWSYKGWLETVIKTGKVLETKELPSGFIIQKRLANNT